MPTPEQLARQNIDAELAQPGWVVQDYRQLNLAAGPGVAVNSAAEKLHLTMSQELGCQGSQT